MVVVVVVVGEHGPCTNVRSMSSGQTSLEPSLRSFLCLRCGVRDFKGCSESYSLEGRMVEDGTRNGGRRGEARVI